MSKILNIYTLGKIGDRLGGPMAYLFNLKSHLDKVSCEHEVSYLDFERNVTKGNGVKASFKNVIRKYLPHVIKEKYLIDNVRKLVNSKKQYLELNKSILENSDVLFCHSTIDCYIVSEICRKYGFNKKIVMTSHTPVPFSHDIFFKLKDNHGIEFHKVLEFYRYIDVLAYSAADKIFFPCEESLQIYEKYLPDLKRDDIKVKIEYLATGINRCEPELTIEGFKNKYNIDKDKIVISYIGKRNTIKGFDKLLELHQLVVKSPVRDKVVFVIAGDGPIQAPARSDIIDIGWTKDPFSIINASDYFILANRETYFDLIALEVLSLGTKLLASNNGGNCHLNKILGDQCIQLFNFENDFEKIINLLNSHESYDKEKNSDQFFSNFSMDVFVRDYFEKVLK